MLRRRHERKPTLWTDLWYLMPSWWWLALLIIGLVVFNVVFFALVTWPSCYSKPIGEAPGWCLMFR